MEQSEGLPLDQVSEGPRRVEGRYRIVVTSRRKRLLDYDNLCIKFLIDGLRHCGVIPDDNPAIIGAVELRQEKITKGEEPETIVEIFEI